MNITAEDYGLYAYQAEDYLLVNSEVVTLTNDLGITDDFEWLTFENKDGDRLYCLSPYIKMPVKLPSNLFPPNNYKVTNV